MNPLEYFISYYGTSSWKDITLAWGGTGTSWQLFEVNNPTAIYTGADFSFNITSSPNTRGDYRIETTVGGVLYTATIMTYTTVLPTPGALAASSVTSSSATLTWSAIAGVDGYDVADVAESYEVVEEGLVAATLSMTGLTPSTRYSRAVRSVYETNASSWSSPVTFFTNASTVVTPGVYDFSPTTIYTWARGRAGSTNPEWLAAASNWGAGDGISWGDNRGVLSTYFFYGSPNQFIEYSAGSCTRIQIYLDRNGPTGDPGVVLSRWALHSYYEKPGSQPATPTAETDVGYFSRGGYGWVDLPTEWGQQLIEGDYAYGILWGGTPERYQTSLYADIEISPRTGNLKITVS